jgi:DNA-binding NtrC family response regulator
MISLLLVDDEPAYLDTLSKRLRKRGFDISTAQNADDALRRLGDAAVDVVLLDVKMPGMDGLEALGLIKQTHPLVEVILHTGHASLEASVQGLELGAFDYVLKPAELEELVHRIEDAAHKKALAQRQHELGTDEPLGDKTGAD